MGLLDAVVGAIGGPEQPGQPGDLLATVIGLIGQNGGGLAQWVEQFRAAGLGDVIASWVGTGSNLPITAEQISAVLGNDAVRAVARQLGLTEGEAAGRLSESLPQIVDTMTPNGTLPEGGTGDLGDLGGMLGGLLGSLGR